MKIEKYLKTGTCEVKINEAGVHIQQPDPVTSAKQWIIISEPEFKDLVQFGSEYFAKIKTTRTVREVLKRMAGESNEGCADD